MKKKTYCQPIAKTLNLQFSQIICFSIHNDEATIVGAKNSSFTEDAEADEE